jgi:microcystin-dependent protein
MIVNTGAILPFGGTTPPSGFLACDGSAVSRTTYVTLFGIVGTTFGAGDGSTTFNLPDLRGRTVAQPTVILSYIIATQDGLGAATATSLSFTSTSGIIGTTTNNDATAGSVGEYVTANVISASAVNVLTNTPTNVTSITLTAGDWDVRGQVAFVTTATTQLSRIEAAISNMSATRPNAWDDTQPVSVMLWNSFQPGTTTFVLPTASGRVSIASSATLYLIAYSLLTVSTLGGYGFIAARRIR